MKNCVYRFLNKDNEVIYIGKAKNLKSRILSHTHLPKECYNEKVKIEYIVLSTMDEADMVERYFIAKLKPKYNTDLKAKEINIVIEKFETFKWVDYNIEDKNAKNEVILTFKDKKKIVKIDMEIQKLILEAENIEKQMGIISGMEESILDLDRGRPIVVHIDEDTRYHIYKDDELYNSDTVTKNSEGLDKYAELYEKWYDEYNKKEVVDRKIDKLKNKKIDLLLKIHNKKDVDNDIRRVYIKYESVNNEFIVNKILKEKEQYYKEKIVKEILDKGFYNYRRFIEELDYEFVYNKYLNEKHWLRLIEDSGHYEEYMKYADEIIDNIESYLEENFGVFTFDTVIEYVSSSLNKERVIKTAILIKKPIA